MNEISKGKMKIYRVPKNNVCTGLMVRAWGDNRVVTREDKCTIQFLLNI